MLMKVIHQILNYKDLKTIKTYLVTGKQPADNIKTIYFMLLHNINEHYQLVYYNLKSVLDYRDLYALTQNNPDITPWILAGLSGGL